ncbi:MAG: hypothetical protein R8K22_01820 [Mariprofundaceae bacterium]
MSQVTVKCTSCANEFSAEESEIYECPKCGSNVRPPKKNTEDFDKTQIFKV